VDTQDWERPANKINVTVLLNLVAKLVLGLLHEAKDESTENRL
jgi:hypothetical protein